MAALVVYASLYPFSGWRWPPGQTLAAMLRLPWPPWIDVFDEALNLIGYVPLGLLAMIAARRSGLRWGTSLLAAVVAPAFLSYSAEVAQNFLPGRHPSLKDLAMNALGACCGAGLAALLHAVGLIGRWQGLRERWFRRRSAGALALLALWPVALLFPAPVPWALGHFGQRLRESLADWLVDVSWAESVYEALLSPAESLPLGSLTEIALSTLGLLAPCLLAYAVVAPGWRRVVMAAGALVLGTAAMALSTLLNFGPQHALSWMTSSSFAALAVAGLLALLVAPLSNGIVVGGGLVVLTGLAVLSAQAPADPYFAQNLQDWEQGRFVRFHGLAQWIGWGWPYLAIAWLLSRQAERE